MLRRVLATAFVAGVLATLTASAQTTPVPPTRLALEVHIYPNEPPAYVVVIPTGVPAKGNIFFRFARVPSWTPRVGSLRVEGITICPVLAGDLVRVSVSVLMGTLLDQEKDVAVYTLREGEKLNLTDLTRFGVEPFEVALVRVAPTSPAPPQFISKGKSIELVSLQPKVSTFPTYRLGLRNVSNKNVSAISLKVLADGRPGSTGGSEGEEGKPLILAGGVSEITVLTKTRAEPTPGGYQPITPASQIIEVSTVIFDDGTFEGDIEPAAGFRAYVKGEKIQLRRVVDLFQGALQNVAADPSSDLESLRKTISALGLDPDPSAQQEIAKEFPDLAKVSKRDLTSTIAAGMSQIRQDVSEYIAQFPLKQSELSALAFRTWLIAARQKYESWLERL